MSNKINSMTILAISVFLTILCGSPAAYGKIIYVDDDAFGNDDGSSWINAYVYLQDALYASLEGDEIRVAQGIYTPDQGFIPDANTSVEDLREASFQLINDVNIIGGFAGLGISTSSSDPLDPNTRDIEAYRTILSGVLNDDVDPNDPLSILNYSRTVVTGSNTDETAILDGFTITGGSGSLNGAGIHIESGSPTIMNCSLISIDLSFPYKVDSEFSNHNGSNPNIINCTISNSSSRNGAMHNEDSSPVLTNCTFQGNSDTAIEQRNGCLRLQGCLFIDNTGVSSGGISSSNSDLIINDCIFRGNSAAFSGGAIDSRSGGSLNLNNCDFINNTGSSGGAIDCKSNATISNCTFNGNSAENKGGAIDCSDSILQNCRFIGNNADEGGALEISKSDIQNCSFEGNVANHGSAICIGIGTYEVLYNCTIYGNSGADSVIYKRSGGTLDLSGCIIWNNNSNTISGDDISVTYSNIQGSWPGVGNINEEPWFVDPLGPDYIFGTGDEDLRLSPLSPCVDSGDPNYITEPDETDLDGNPRVFSGRIDMGAYEYQGIIYVDDDAPYIQWPMYIDLAYPAELGTKNHPFDSIQEAIDLAKDEYTILVRRGVYSKINCLGKAITVACTEGAAVIEASPNNLTDSLEQDAVTFYTGEGPDSILKNFIIRNSGIAISLNYGSSPTIQNVTIVDNHFGIAAYEDSNPDISNCILWNNRDGDLYQCVARYSCLEDEAPGEGNIYVNPLFVDAANGDYHLKSEGWRWNDVGQSWTWDEVTSRCIDAGDPCSPLGNEPMRIPRDPNNEYGINRRINMGAYGGTCQASMPPLDWPLPEEDNTPPSPDPAQWAPDGAPIEVYGAGGTFDFYVEMTAMEATDDSGYVEYYFECVTEAGFSSCWISSPSYSVLIGRSGQGHIFRVKARDMYGNETAWSDERTAQEPIIF